mmetsp:Transcript_32698/g.66354  ORF Transcript_32698/g.66354 Transcript_32698/m.66354 type:complete len:154 (+) Transcript_32698:3-464(+)
MAFGFCSAAQACHGVPRSVDTSGPSPSVEMELALSCSAEEVATVHGAVCLAVARVAGIAASQVAVDAVFAAPRQPGVQVHVSIQAESAAEAERLMSADALPLCEAIAGLCGESVPVVVGAAARALCEACVRFRCRELPDMLDLLPMSVHNCMN